MISISIVSDTPAADWIDTEAGWQSGPNLISLIDNCCLKRAMLVADGGLIFIVAARGAVVLSRSELRCFILYGPQLAQETIVIGVKQLFAGQSASWSAGQTEIEIDPMVECESLEQSVLRPGAHVTAVFVDLINLSCRAVLQHAARPALELSGGMDSSCVAVALKAADRAFLSYALLHDGNAGHQQKLRRMELLSQLNCTDCCIPSKICKPFTRLQQPCAEGDDCIGVYDDLYWDGILECLNAMPGGRPDLVITGIGGMR